MTLIVNLNDSKQAALQPKALAYGVSAEQYVQQMIDQDLESFSGQQRGDLLANGETARSPAS